MAQSGMSVQEMRKVMTGFNHQMKDGVSDASRGQLINDANKAVLVPTHLRHTAAHMQLSNGGHHE